MRVFYAIGLLLLINGQVNSLATTPDEEDSQSKFEERLSKEVEDLILEIAELRDHANSLIEKQIADGQLMEIEKSAVDALDEFHTWQELIGSEQGIQQLEILKKSSISKFLKCDRLKQGLGKIAKMIEKTSKVTINVGELVKFVADGLSHCKGGKLKVTICVGKFMFKLADKIHKLVPKLKAYKLDMKELTREVKEIYKHCSK